MRTGARASVLLMVLLIAVGCVTTDLTIEQPEGFARFADEDTYRVMSPEGVRMEVRSLENSPPQDLDFWAEALAVHLESSGYVQLRRETFESPAGEGVVFEWLAPVGAQDFVYMTALLVSEGRIVLIEAAGPYEHFQNYREELHRSLGTVALNVP